MSLLDHQELKIVKGIGPVPGDSSSAEQPLVVVNLMDENSGISLVDWSPNIPSLKSGGVWADSPVNDGRSLAAGANTNVIETMMIDLTAASYSLFAAKFAALQRMVQDARAFWTTFNQIEPVYLKWWAAAAPGPQYALIYNIDLSTPEFGDSNSAVAEFTLSIEREFGWRGVKPGGNPKEWTYSPSSKNLGQFNSSKAALTTGSDHLAYQALQNRREWNAGQTALLTQNHITIDSTLIPGDLPALCYLAITIDNVGASGFSVNQAFVGKSTKPDIVDRSGVTKTPNYTLNAAEPASFGSDTTAASDTGAPIAQDGVSRLRGRVTFSGVPGDALRFPFGPAARAYVDGLLTRGQFAVFARARLSAAGNVALHLTDIPPVNLTTLGGGGTSNTTYWELVYLGVISVPPGQDHTLASTDGKGVEVSALASGIGLYASRVSGTPELYVGDLILLPIDEGSCVINGVNLVAGHSFIIDSTGYTNHGLIDGLFIQDTTGTAMSGGDAIFLTPGVDNTLHILINASNHSPLDFTYSVRVNIVPRWSGVRDV